MVVVNSLTRDWRSPGKIPVQEQTTFVHAGVTAPKATGPALLWKPLATFSFQELLTWGGPSFSIKSISPAFLSLSSPNTSKTSAF